jgi:hypothetical protein
MAYNAADYGLPAGRALLIREFNFADAYRNHTDYIKALTHNLGSSSSSRHATTNVRVMVDNLAQEINDASKL